MLKLCSKRILCVIGKMDSGGAETMLMKLFRSANKRNIKFDFAVFTDDEGFYDREILSMGGIVYKLGSRKKPMQLVKNYIDLIRTQKYEFVLQSTEKPHRAIFALLAKWLGTKCVAVRSTNSRAFDGRIFNEVEKMLRWIPLVATDVRFAPSQLAADFLFGRDRNVFILRNGINLQNYHYDSSISHEYKAELGIEDCLVVGHIGRFEKQKNHVFLMKIFCEILKTHRKSVLLMVGIGSLQKELQQYAMDLGISHNVKFLGRRKDIPELLMAMDVLVFPSLYEGMPNVVIEAQATGLPCLVSDSITSECKLTNIVKFLSLQDSATRWAEEAIKYADMTARESYGQKVKDCGYDINEVTDNFLKKMGVLSKNI